MSKLKSGEIIAGIDLSLRATGFTIVDHSGKIIYEELFKTAKMRDMQRVFFIKSRLHQKLKEYKVTKVAIEGYSFGSKGRSIVSLGELGGCVRMMMFEGKFEYLDCSPSSLKAYTSGKGNADKNQMKAAVLAKYGRDYADDNMCDSYALCMMQVELGDEMKKYCSKGGAALLKGAQEKAVRVKEGQKGNFADLLKLGRAKVKDIEAAIMAHNKLKDNSPAYEFLGIKESEYKLLTQKAVAKALKQLNKEYSY